MNPHGRWMYAGCRWVEITQFIVVELLCSAKQPHDDYVLVDVGSFLQYTWYLVLFNYCSGVLAIVGR